MLGKKNYADIEQKLNLIKTSSNKKLESFDLSEFLSFYQAGRFQNIQLARNQIESNSIIDIFGFSYIVLFITSIKPFDGNIL